MNDLKYKLYQQDGTFQHMTCKDTPSNRKAIKWVRIHDRYTKGDSNE